jgi:hypothetical protein
LADLLVRRFEDGVYAFDAGFGCDFLVEAHFLSNAGVHLGDLGCLVVKERVLLIFSDDAQTECPAADCVAKPTHFASLMHQMRHSRTINSADSFTYSAEDFADSSCIFALSGGVYAFIHTSAHSSEMVYSFTYELVDTSVDCGSRIALEDRSLPWSIWLREHRLLLLLCRVVLAVVVRGLSVDLLLCE